MPADRRKTSSLATWFALALIGLAEVAIALLAVTGPASTQTLDDRFPFMQNRRRLYEPPQQQQQPQRQQDPDFGWGYQQPQQRQAPAESTRAPAARRPDAPPTTNIVVFGDAMSEWLAYGLEEALAETPEIGVTRKARANTGLIRTETRNESYDWPTSAREILNADKPDFVVMMLGLADRRGIRERIAPQRPPAGQKQAATPAQQPAPAQGAPAAAPAAKPPVDAEAPPADRAQDRVEDEQSSIMVPEGAVAGMLTHEFRSEKWGELYSRRIDEMIGVLKSRGVPVFWVGLPAVRGTRATSEAVYLNDLYRGRAEKAGITYIDVWDGFVDDSGNYNNYGPDFEGQTRRLRTADGANFTRAGARKLAHYVEREIRRVMLARVAPVATPLPEPEPEAKAPPTAAAPGLPPRPIASPAMSLTAPTNTGDTLLGGAAARSATPDTIVTRVLVKGEPVEAPPGRADDFAWPRRDVVTATGVLPPDPLPPEPTVASSSADEAQPAAAPAVPRRAVVRQAPRERTTENGWRPWGGQQQQQPYQERQRWNNGWNNNNNGGGFFGGWFGR